MRIGVIFPQTEITEDPGAVREYTLAAEALGYRHVLAFDHVVGADITNRPTWGDRYTVHSLFHEPLVLFGYLAALTQHIEFVTGILILPQRQTVLVAKQAAELDVLSGGRLRLGVAVGWNDVEYQALGESFTNRGKRIDEQIAVLRALFTQQSVTFHGRWHHVEAAGIKPMPVQRPIPIWIGGYVPATLDRIARIGDGWFPQADPEIARPHIERLRSLAQAAGRDPASIGIEGRLNISTVKEEHWVPTVRAWHALGASHLGVSTMNAGLASPQEHIDAIRRFSEVVVPAAW
jgi:probable F420-dependent oxidoreductase